MPLALVFLAPAAAHGASRIGARAPRSALRGAPAAILAVGLLLLVSPWLWGVGKRLDPVDVPASWYDARELVGDEGTVLALPGISTSTWKSRMGDAFTIHCRYSSTAT